MGISQKIIRLIDRYYILICTFHIPIILYFNWPELKTARPAWHDLNFKTIILSGFDPFVIEAIPTPTFPQWGYGFLLLLTENVALLIGLQLLLSLFALFIFISTIEKTEIVSKVALFLIKCLLIFSFYLPAINLQLNPKGIGLSLFLLSLTFLIKALDQNRTRHFILSGLFFGLMLNFRSDYWLLPVGVLVCMPILFSGKQLLKKLLLWLICIYGSLMPWGFYTKKVTGHYLLTSTNSGHVCFIGLGLLNPNPWGVTPDDGDPKMQALLTKQFGSRANSSYFSCTYDGDAFLKKAWLRAIFQHPIAYVKKCLYCTWLFAKSGIERQGFYETSRFTIHWFFVLFSLILAQTITLFGSLSALFAAYIGWLRQNKFIFLFALIVYYQAALNIFCYHMTVYTTNVYILLITLLSYCLQQLLGERIAYFKRATKNF